MGRREQVSVNVGSLKEIALFLHCIALFVIVVVITSLLITLFYFFLEMSITLFGTCVFFSPFPHVCDCDNCLVFTPIFYLINSD